MRACLLALTLAGCASTHGQTATAVSPQPLPPIELVALDGAHQTLDDALAGRPALMSLWATWCETCMTELGALGRLSPKAQAQGAYVVAISEGEEAATVAAFTRAKALQYPQLVDERFALADAVGSRRVPATIVVDAAGRVVFRGGTLDEASLRALDRAIAAAKSSH